MTTEGRPSHAEQIRFLLAQPLDEFTSRFVRTVSKQATLSPSEADTLAEYYDYHGSKRGWAERSDSEQSSDKSEETDRSDETLSKLSALLDSNLSAGQRKFVTSILNDYQIFGHLKPDQQDRLDEMTSGVFNGVEPRTTLDKLKWLAAQSLPTVGEYAPADAVRNFLATLNRGQTLERHQYNYVDSIFSRYYRRPK